jgi:TonB-linked SusC/RagA family outer membrane protein
MNLKSLIGVLGVLLPVLSLFSQPLSKPNGTHISVTIVNSNNQSPVTGALLLLKKSHSRAVTNATGNATIRLTATTDTLIISHIAYQSKQIAVSAGSTSPILITLQENTQQLQEVIVSTGYQALPKERATGSFAFVDNQLLNKRVSTDIISKLEGNVPGLLFNRNVSSTLSNTGGNNLSIRGHNTLFANDQPLVIVDGFPYDGDITNLNPADVDNISILKDAAASSIWGVRSGNGVIVITTKKGRPGQKLAVEVNANITVGNKPDLYYSPNWINSTDFIDIEEKLYGLGYYANDLGSPYFTPVSPVVALLDQQSRGLISAADATTQINALRNNDFRKDETKYLYRHSVNQQYAVNLRGGGANSDYFFSMGFDNNTANQVGNKSYRVTLNSANNFYLFKGFTLSAGFNYSISNATGNSPLANLNPNAAKVYYPYAQLVDASGKSQNLVKDYASSYTDTAGGGQFLNWKYNPLDELKYADNTNKSIDNRLNLGVKYVFLNGFSAELKYQYERLNGMQANYYSDSTYYARNLINEFTDLTASNAQGLKNPIPIGGILNQAFSVLNAHHLRGQLSYAHTFNTKHDLAIITGAEINQNVAESSNYSSYGYDKSTGGYSLVDLVDYFQTNPSGSLSTIPNSGTGFGKITNRYISYYANGAYTYNNTYIISASARIDKSNLFGDKANQKSVPLYSTGLAWVFSKEPFYHSTWLPYGKLRITYGYNANINTGYTAFTTALYVGNSSYYSQLPYSIITNPGNPELHWEKIRMINLALDFAVKKEILSGSLELYFKKGEDIIGQAPLAPSTGLTTLYGNFSNTQGHGIDINLNSINISGKSFKWTSNFMFSYAMDKVTKYDVTTTALDYINGGDGSGGSVYPLNGKPVFSVYSYRWEGLNANGDPQGFIGGKVSTDYGNIISNTTLDSMVYNGPARPTIFGSFRNTFSYKGVSLSFNIIYKLNYYFRRSSINYLELYAGWEGNRDYYKRWQRPGDEKITNVPSMQLPPGNQDRETFYQYSSVLVDKGDHIRLQDISISYDLIPYLKKRTPFTTFSVYGYMNNIGILWRANKDKIDPDLYANSLPLPRTYSFGFKANF